MYLVGQMMVKVILGCVFDCFVLVVFLLVEAYVASMLIAGTLVLLLSPYQGPSRV